MNGNRISGSGTIIGGLLLIGLGMLFLLGQFLGFDVWHYLWPLFILGFGLLFFAGMVAGGKEAGGLAIPGSLFTILGLLFLYQNTFAHWASWAYAWALLAPTGVGIGLMIFARWSDKPSLYGPGWLLVIIGLAIFLVMGAFFELAVGLAGYASPGRFLWPVLLILIGLFLLFRRSFHWLTPPLATKSSTPTAQTETKK
jgi:hypothetical protein